MNTGKTAVLSINATVLRLLASLRDGDPNVHREVDELAKLHVSAITSLTEDEADVYIAVLAARDVDEGVAIVTRVAVERVREIGEQVAALMRATDRLSTKISDRLAAAAAHARGGSLQ